MYFYKFNTFGMSTELTIFVQIQIFRRQKERNTKVHGTNLDNFLQKQTFFSVYNSNRFHQKHRNTSQDKII